MVKPNHQTCRLPYKVDKSVWDDALLEHWLRLDFQAFKHSTLMCGIVS